MICLTVFSPFRHVIFFVFLNIFLLVPVLWVILEKGNVIGGNVHREVHRNGYIQDLNQKRR